MLVELSDGRCRTCGGQLKIVAVDDATMDVECTDETCGDAYTVEPDAFGDGAMTYIVDMHTRPQEAQAPNPAHCLMPEEIAKNLPRLYATEREADALAGVKYFTPDSSWTWFVTEYDPEQRLCFGLIIGHERELGYFSLDELEQPRGPLGLKVERDLYFEPTHMSKCGGPA